MARAERADNEHRRRAGRLPVRTGFGVNSGAVMMGIVGGETSLRATIMGDAVNLASRIQELTKRYDTSMLVSEDTAARLGAATKVTLRPLEQVQVVGKSKPIHVFEVLDALEDHHCHRRTASLDVYMRAIAAYQSGELGEAHRGFADVVAADPDDAPAVVMLERVDQLIASGEVFAGTPITRMDRK